MLITISMGGIGRTTTDVMYILPIGCPCLNRLKCSNMEEVNKAIYDAISFNNNEIGNIRCVFGDDRTILVRVNGIEESFYRASNNHDALVEFLQECVLSHVKYNRAMQSMTDRFNSGSTTS